MADVIKMEIRIIIIISALIASPIIVGYSLMNILRSFEEIVEKYRRKDKIEKIEGELEGSD